MEKGDSVPTRTWFSDDDDGKDQGMKAVQIVQEKWNSSKIKYDGLFGFSQGSSLILLCCLICVIIIIVYIEKIDNLLGGENDEYGRKVRYIYFKGGQISYWSFTHFLFFMLLGFICPGYLYLIIVLGVIWELMELFFEYNRQTEQSEILCKYVNKCKNIKKISKSKFWDIYLGRENKPTRLFYCSAGYLGQLLDILFNIVGYIFGAKLHRMFFNDSINQ